MHKRALGAAAVTGVAALLMSACGGSRPTAPAKTPAPLGQRPRRRSRRGVPRRPTALRPVT